MIIHSALGMSVLVVGAVFYFLIESGQSPDVGGFPEFIIYFPVFFLVITLMVSRMVFTNQVKKMDRDTSLKHKLEIFFVGHIVRVALFEASGILAAVICFITGNTLNMIVVLTVVLFFFMLRPTENRIAMDLNLSASDRDELENLK